MTDQEELLEKYSKELGLRVTMTLHKLIESHKFLRKEYKKTQQEVKEAIENNIKQIKEYDYVKIENLLNMTLQQICDKYYEKE